MAASTRVEIIFGCGRGVRHLVPIWFAASSKLCVSLQRGATRGPDGSDYARLIYFSTAE